MTVSGNLCQDLAFATGWDALAPAYSAINTASSIFSANATFPPYTTAQWALPAFQLEKTVLPNSTLSAVLPAILTATNCERTQIAWSSLIDGTVTGLETGYSFDLSIE